MWIAMHRLLIAHYRSLSHISMLGEYWTCLSTVRVWGSPPQQSSNLCKENACIHGMWGLGHLEHLWLKVTLKRQDFYVGPLEQIWVHVLAVTAAVVPVGGVSSCPQGIFSENQVSVSSCGALKAAKASGRQLLRSPKKRLLD